MSGSSAEIWIICKTGTAQWGDMRVKLMVKKNLSVEFERRKACQQGVAFEVKMSFRLNGFELLCWKTAVGLLKMS